MKFKKSRVTNKFHAIIPEEICKILGLKAGDSIVYEVTEDNHIQIRKAYKRDMGYLKAVEQTLQEWNSDEDNEAFKDL